MEKNTKDNPKKKFAKLSVSINDDQGEFNVSSDITGTLLQSPQNVQTVSNGASSMLHSFPAHASDTLSDSATILIYLWKTDGSNEDLSKQVQDLEAGRSQFNLSSAVSTTLSMDAHTNLGPKLPEPTSVKCLAQNQLTAMVPGSETTVNCDYMTTASLGTQLNLDLWDNHQPSALCQTHSQLAAMASNSKGAAQGGSQATIQQFSNDGILPDLHGLCHNPHISQSVSQILSAYDAQARQESIQGKPAQVKKFQRQDGPMRTISELMVKR